MIDPAAADAIVAALPPHKAGLTIEHNPQCVNYETVAAWLENMREGEPDWSSPEARQRAIDADDVWVMQWYPYTPVGFNMVAAPTLAELLAFAAE